MAKMRRTETRAILVLAAVFFGDAAFGDDIGPIRVTVSSNVLTVRMAAPSGKYNLVSFHMRLDRQIQLPEQGTIASPDLHAPRDYKRGAWVWSGHVPGMSAADLRGKTIYYWVRVEENGVGKNGTPRQTIIH